MTQKIKVDQFTKNWTVSENTAFLTNCVQISFRIDNLGSELTKNIKVNQCTQNWAVGENTVFSTNLAQISFRIDNYGSELTQKNQSWPLY